MSVVSQTASSLCLFAVVLGVIHFLLPHDGIGEYVRMGGRILMVALTAQLLLTVPNMDWKPSDDAPVSADHPEQYLSDRLAESASKPIEEEVRKSLSQFGINHGQIRIDFDKSDYGDITLAHISVGIPKDNESDKAALKRLLLNRFGVFCDVYLLEETDHET